LPEQVVRDQSRRFTGPTYAGRVSLDTTGRAATDIVSEIVAMVEPSNEGSGASP
jgi:hypothetical protein